MGACLGGPFNPPNQGHIKAGLEAINEIGVERLGLLPCKFPPHKTAPETTTAHRLKMLELACEDEPALYVEPLELSLPAPYDTVKTLQHIRRTQGNEPLLFLLGEDTLYNLRSWYHWQEMTDFCHIVVMRRPASAGEADETLRAWLTERPCTQIETFYHQPAGLVYYTNSQDYAVSSTQLRDALTAQTTDPVGTDWLQPPGWTQT